MTILPENEPFGVATGLKAPDPAATERARAVFERLFGPVPTDGQAPAGSSPAAAPQPLRFGGGRRYDVAMAVLQQGAVAEAAPLELPPASGTPWAGESRWVPAHGAVDAEELPLIEAIEEALDEEPGVEGLMDDPDDPDEITAVTTWTELHEAHRPPPGAPTVRPSVPAPPSVPQTLTEEEIEAASDSAFFQVDPDGRRSFDISFSDDLFEDLACNISVLKGRVIATFRVADVNVRRLLEAEAGRLRAGLERRGLRVEDIRVMVG